MRKNGIATRIGAIILAASMIMVDAVPTLAAGAVNDVSVEQDILGAVNGVSKVIGLEGRPTSITRYSDDGTIQIEYTTPYRVASGVYVFGKAEDYMDAATGFYKLGDTYYAYAYQQADACVCLDGKVAWQMYVPTGQDSSTLLPQADATTGLYTIDGKTYESLSENSITEKDANGAEVYKGSNYYVLANDSVELLGALAGTYTDWDEMYAAAYEIYGKKLAATDVEYAYFEANGKAYESIYVVYDSEYDSEQDVYVYTVKSVYAYKMDSIDFDKRYHYISWNEVSNETEIDSNGKVLQVGYQIKENGVITDTGATAVNGSNIESISFGNDYTSMNAYAATERVKYEVRAVYYTETNTVTRDEYGYETGRNNYTIVKVGEWSEPYTYAWATPTQTVPQVTGLNVTQKSAAKAEITWNKVDVASGYQIQRIRSVEPITDFAKAEDQWRYYTDTENTFYRLNNSSFGGYYEEDVNGEEQYVEYKYAYYRVCAYVDYDAEKYVNTYGSYSEPVQVARNAVTNTPAIKGLKVENNSDGSFTLKWNKIDAGAKVVVYYSTDKNVFTTSEYTYNLVDAMGMDYQGTETTVDDEMVYLTNTFSLQDKLAIVNKKVEMQYLDEGVNNVCSDELNLVPGKKYYFVVATYDDVNYNTDRSATTPYVANVARVAGETRNVSFGYYNDVVTSSVISAKEYLSICEPSTKSSKTSITMSFDKKDSSITGYQIYRKSGSKYKKVAAISSAEYVDKQLKENTVYKYKVRAYYYNPDTKDKAYSDYVYFSAETSANNYLNLKVDKKSKTSAKLTWTKVSGATKYEIYRSNTSSYDTNYSKKNGYGNGEFALGNEKWELVKTINKAKTVTYTDKKLTSGEIYNYRVVATYKSGKITKQLYATDYVTLKLTAPENVKTTLSGNNVKVTWDKDKYASKYEVSYIKYDAQGRAQTDDYVVATTKKTSYTIKNVPAGGTVCIRVRAYGSKQWSGYIYLDSVDGKELATAKSVSVKEVTEKNANGVESTAVKVSWKKVSGAAYYRVYRSTSPASGYNTDEKYYLGANDSMYYIAKESNADEKEDNSVAYYKDYKGQNGTIVGTSAVDRARLQTGVTYYYYVLAYSADGERVSVGYSKPASICYKATPSIKKITAKKGKTVVTINKVAGAKKYVIYRSTKKSSGYKEIGTTTKTTYTDKTTKKGKTYYYKVVAVGTNGLNADFESAKSKAVKVKAK